MGETNDGSIPDSKFIHKHLKFTKAHLYDSMQFLITGRISDAEDFEIKRN